MSRYLYSVLTPSADKSWMASRVKKHIPKTSRTLIDPLFTSDLFLTMPQWEDFILRPRTEYESRVIEALMKSGLNWIEELNDLFSRNKPFSFHTEYRPRILTSISDAEILAYTTSTQKMVQETNNGLSRERVYSKYKINKDKILRSLLRLYTILQTKNTAVIPPSGRMPISLIGNTDVLLLNVGEIPKELFTEYVDPLSWKGKKVLLVGSLSPDVAHFADEYEREIVQGPRKRVVHIIRNYQL